MKLLLFLFLLHSSISTSTAQITMVGFLQSAFEAPGVNAAQAQLSYLQTKPYKLSPLQKLEFRTRINEMSVDKQRYALRFAPANPWEMRSNNRYFKEYQTYLSIGSKLALKEALLERYQVICELVYYQRLKSLADENVQLIEKQLNVMQRQSTSSFFDADEYVDLKVEHLDKVVNAEEATFELMNQQSLVNKLYPASFGKKFEFDLNDLISVEQINSVIDSLKQQEVNSLLVAYHQQKLSVDKSRYVLEKNNINLGFLQAEYDERRVEQDRTPYTIGLGVTIPITNPNKGDMARQKLNTIETEYELKEAEADEKANKESSYSRVKEMINHYNALKSKISELENSELAANLSLVKEGDPMVRIKYHTSLNKLRVVEEKLKRKVYAYYIEYLFAGDYLQPTPLVNFMTGNMQVISPK